MSLNQYFLNFKVHNNKAEACNELQSIYRQQQMQNFFINFEIKTKQLKYSSVRKIKNIIIKYNKYYANTYG